MVNISKIQIPPEWLTATLGGVAKDMLSGGTPSTKNDAYWKGTIPWITSKWLDDNLYLRSGEKFISQDAIENSAAKIVPSGNLIFATRVGVGKVSVNAIDLAINQDLAGIVIDKQQTTPEFLAYQLRTGPIQQFVEQNKRGATIKGITKSCLSEIALLLPPFPEQRRIAAVLSLVQQAIEQQERLIALTTELKKVLMHKLFTEGTRGEPQKQTEIGPIPKSWEVVSIGEIADVTKLAGFEYTKYVKYVEDGGVIAIRGLNLKDGKLNLSDVKRIKQSVSDLLPRSKLHIDDVLLSYVGTVGGVAIVDAEDKYHLAPNVAKLTVKEKSHFCPNYLASYLLSDVGRRELFMNVSKTSQPVISMARIRSLNIAIPAHEEQIEICSYIKAVDHQIEVGTGKLLLLTNLFRTLLHQLMTAEIRVNDLDLEELGIKVGKE